jgi:hypothetical protein
MIENSSFLQIIVGFVFSTAYHVYTASVAISISNHFERLIARQCHYF